MYVSVAPLTFTTGDILAASDVNGLYLYCRDAVADVAQKRWAKGIATFQCVTDTGTPYTNASGALLVVKFRCPQTCVVERAFLNANMTQSGGAVTVNVTASSGGATPTGCAVPWLSTGATAIVTASTDTLDSSADRFILAADTWYDITIAGSTFSLERFDLTLHVAVDRWTLAGTTSVPDFDPTLVTDASARDATVVAANNTALTTESSKFANAKTAVMPMVFQCHGFLSGTDTDLLKFTIPRIATARGRMVVKAMTIDAIMASNAASTVTATLYNAAASSQAAITATVTGVTRAQNNSAVSVTLNGAAAETTANDYYLQFANADAAVVCTRCQVILWVARA